MANKSMNVKTGDTVLVIAGKDSGKQGKVLATFPSKNRVVVEGVNIISRHTKARSAKETSAIVKKEGTIDVSNVMPVCPTCGKPTRVKHTVVDGKNTRVCKCGAVLDRKFEKVAKKAAATKEKKAKAAETKEKKVSTKVEKGSKASAKTVKNKAEGASVKRKQEM